MRRRRGVSGAVLVTVVAITAVVTVEAQSSGSASTATLRPMTHTGSSVRLSPRPVAVVPRPARATRPPLPSPCASNRTAQLVVVSILHQHAWACAYHATVLSTPVTTGASRRPGDATPRGTFAVQGLNRNTVLNTSADGHYRVRYWIPFHLGVWGFHDASWQKIRFGSQGYVTRGSHGCVHMPLAAIRRLFHWVHYGTPVRIT